MTSNVGSDRIQEFSNKDNDQVEQAVMPLLKETFRPEFLNRIDDIIIFHSLGEDEIIKIVDLQLDHVTARLAEQGYILSFSNKLKDYIAAEGYDRVYGARPLKRVIEHQILDPLALEIIEKKLKSGKNITVDRIKGQTIFK